MDSSFRKLRLIYWGLLAAIPLFGVAAEIGSNPGSSTWTWRHWWAAGLCCWVILGAFSLRSRLVDRSKERLGSDPADARAARGWEVGQIVTLAMAEGVAFWGLVVRMVFGGTLWQASLFYLSALALILLWAPRLPITKTGA
jgi:hypothetical protein